MIEDMTLNELLAFLATCSGDEATAMIERFQRGGMSIAGILVDEIEAV